MSPNPTHLYFSTIKSLANRLLKIRRKINSLSVIAEAKDLNERQIAEANSLIKEAEKITAKFQRFNYPTDTRSLQNFLRRSRSKEERIRLSRSSGGVGMYGPGSSVRRWR